jgi:hypothetical protein
VRNEVDRERFPTLNAYVAQLPQGLNSYPEARSKGSLLRSSLEGHDVGRLIDDVLRAVIESPPPAGVWVPAVHSDAVFHAVVDRFHPTDERVIAWCEGRTLSMAKSPMYGALFRVSGPAILIRGTARFHGLAQRGTEMSAILDDHRARLHMSFPPHLHSRLNLLSNVGMFRGLIRITGGQTPQAKMTRFSATDADYECTWT